MKTLLIENGDLVLGEGGFAMISGARKTRQDLAIALREPFGCDRFHPRWGSMMNSFVGQSQSAFTEAQVVGEINRVVQNYMFVQSSELQEDVAFKRAPRFGTGELVASLDGVRVRPYYDSYRVKVFIRTASGEEIILQQSVTADGGTE